MVSWLRAIWASISYFLFSILFVGIGAWTSWTGWHQITTALATPVTFTYTDGYNSNTSAIATGEILVFVGYVIVFIGLAAVFFKINAEVVSEEVEKKIHSYFERIQAFENKTASLTPSAMGRVCLNCGMINDYKKESCDKCGKQFN